MYQRHILGKAGEDLATEYLRENNYQILERNFRCKQGEIDIIAKDKYTSEYCFIEIKTRSNTSFGRPIDAVNKIKRKHIILASKYYIMKNKLQNQYIRFDVIEVYVREKCYLNHIKRCMH